MGTMQETVQFNVCGRGYTISRSLLKLYPDSLLAMSASKSWQEDPTAEIFIDRDGDRFRYILDYMRDGNVVLPCTVSKEAVLADLEYYGIEFDDSLVDNTSTDKASCAKHFINTLADIQGVVYDNELQFRSSKFVMDMITTYMGNVLQSKAGRIQSSYTMTLSNRAHMSNVNELFKKYSNAIMLDKINEYMIPLGFKVLDIEPAYDSASEKTVTFRAIDGVNCKYGDKR
jgi:hypothetical protein